MLSLRGLNAGNGVRLYNRNRGVEISLKSNVQNGVKLTFDVPDVYLVTQGVPLMSSGDVFGALLTEGEEMPLVVCEKNPDGSLLVNDNVSLIYFGKPGKIGRGLELNGMASGLEVIEYSALQDSFALQDASVRDLRELVDRKIFSRLRRTA